MRFARLGVAFAALLFAVPAFAAPDEGVFTTNAPTLNDQDLSILRLDTSGNLKVAPNGGTGSTTVLPTFVAPSIAAATSRSGAIITGGTALPGAGTNNARKRYILQNPCSATTQGIATAESLFVSTTGTASASGGSFELLPCGTLDTGTGPAPSGPISIVAATTGHKFTATEQ